MNEGQEIPPELVRELHDFILSSEPGRAGERDAHTLDGALGRVANTIEYDNVEDVYEIAGLYAVAIACGHAFVDCNKRTGLVTALTYLDLQGIKVPRNQILEDVMVDVAKQQLGYRELGVLLYSFAMVQE
jgi:death-on-curing protein